MVDLGVYDLVIFDIDNTLLDRGSPITTGVKMLENALESSAEVVLLTNSASRSREEIQEALDVGGVSIDRSRIITGNELIMEFSRQSGFKRPFVVGKARVESYSENIDFVAVTYTHTIEREVVKALKSLRTPLICLDRSLYFYSSGSIRVGSEWLVKTVEELMGRPATLIGKPSTFSLTLLPRFRKALVVGDSDADLEFSKRIGAELYRI